ncbi:pantothenate kinase [Lactobacillus delbrueckii subsp. delbrueckii DSM 20074 = JCM 1012]|uniref:type I pantothenate kinase n=1 Tax=Lactobacillus delbrueckii TaxID=1584 RepID=UPI00046FB742|nr:type I pantothenate kinase [Lactobacillus delbrueckii]APP10235.1 type I pantothenate kinase [Lactobacillus delbrueckii subsp. delbrueckii DSM 20074 = JCM 1012]KNZ37616.1 pantothenate kinase [Lactobacillus delbrueckii subsp. delbrueckii]KRK25633.1 pantothenate kinase [Lactobacillus delbrueckii subsp. delbrueckii DSM 20074 = JCM 1012]MCT3492895.1 type I pantothenate kinase [Lactobacillus delbrueckii]MCT3521126.1 type I pantothenate kinase [Lactobacillus delbrueckii]
MRNYTEFSRQAWAALTPKTELAVTNEELAKVKSLGDQLDVKDVDEIYQTLLNYIHLAYQAKQETAAKKAEFLQLPESKVPYIIGISGSVAVGKSTTARLLQLLLTRYYPDLKTQMMTTDGFIYPNQELEKRKLMSRKGFPESYNMQMLRDFLQDVVSGKNDVAYPLYSQELSDIVPGRYGHVEKPDILIIEGINTLQLPESGQLVTSDFFDFSIYIDAEEDLIEKWYMQRFKKIMKMKKNDPSNFYYKLANGPEDEALRLAEETWQMVNLVNLRQYIAPTKERANLILHKVEGHLIDKIYLRDF